MAFEEVDGGDQRRDGVVLVQSAVQLARGVLARRRPPDQRQEIDGIGQEALQCEAARDVLQMRVEAAVLVDHQDGRSFAFDLSAREVAADAALG